METKQQSISKKSAVCSLRSVVSPQSAFTLMELLVVLAVIAILIGLLFPALMGARQRAKITRARSEVQTLQQAWLAYWNTYGQTLGWPAAGVISMNANNVKILGGHPDAAAANPQRIAFMEFDERHYQYGFYDPWLENFYQVEFVDPTTQTTDWFYKTRIHCVNTARGRY